MANKNIHKFGHKITKENARAMQAKGAAKKRANRTLFKAFEELDEDGTISSVFETILRNGREENQVKLLALFHQYADKKKARDNGEVLAAPREIRIIYDEVAVDGESTTSMD